MLTFKEIAKVFGVFLLIVFIGLFVGSVPHFYSESLESNIKGSAEIELLAATPEGTKIYKIHGNKMIVPAIVVQSYNGNVAIR